MPALQTLLRHFNDIFASREWEAFADRCAERWRMRWRRHGTWECREGTAEEIEDAELWHAIK